MRYRELRRKRPWDTSLDQVSNLPLMDPGSAYCERSPDRHTRGRRTRPALSANTRLRSALVVISLRPEPRPRGGRLGAPFRGVFLDSEMGAATVERAASAGRPSVAVARCTDSVT